MWSERVSAGYMRVSSVEIEMIDLLQLEVYSINIFCFLIRLVMYSLLTYEKQLHMLQLYHHHHHQHVRIYAHRMS